MMAEARTPRVDKLDPEKINEQWEEWDNRMENFETSDESEKESLLKELEENIPERLIEFEDCIKLFLENRFDLEDVYWIALRADNLLFSIKTISTGKQIESGQLYRLDRLKEKLTGANILGYRGCTLVLDKLKRFSDGLESMKSETDRSDEELLDMINELEINSFYSVDEMKKANERYKEERWLGTLLFFYKRMMKDAQLLNTRMSDTLHVLKSKPSSFELLTKMKSTLENAIESILESDSKVILDPRTEYSHVCSENNDVVVTFSSGTVQSSQEIHIALEPILVEECKSPLTEVAGYSDVIYIRHDVEFLKPVTVTTPVVLIGDCDISSYDLFCVHIDDNELKIQEDVKVEVLNGNLCRFATNTFSSNVLHAKRKIKGNPKKNRKALLKELQTVHGADPHNILVFIGAGPDKKSWKLHTEVVNQEHVEDIINRRKHERSVFELPGCRSPSLLMRGIRQIKVKLGSNGSLDMYKGSSQQQPVINIVKGGKDNFISFPVTRKNNKTMAIVDFKAVGRKGLLHSADFNAGEFDRLQYQAKVQTDLSGNSKPRISSAGTQKTEIQTNAPGNTSDTQKTISETSRPVLSEFFGDKSMLCLAKQISGDDMYQVAIFLNISHVMYQDLKFRCTNEFKMELFKHWLKLQTCSGEEMLSTLCRALNNADLKGIANVVASVYKENRALENADFPN